ALALRGPRPPGPLVERPAGGVDRPLRVGRLGVRSGGDHLAGRRVEHVETAPVERVDPLAVDVVLQLLHHERPPIALNLDSAYRTPRTRRRLPPSGHGTVDPLPVGPLPLALQVLEELWIVRLRRGVVDHRDVRVPALVHDGERDLLALLRHQHVRAAVAWHRRHPRVLQVSEEIAELAGLDLHPAEGPEHRGLPSREPGAYAGSPLRR